MVALSYWWICLHTYRPSWRHKLTAKWNLWERLLRKVTTLFFVLFCLKSRFSHSRKAFILVLSSFILQTCLCCGARLAPALLGCWQGSGPSALSFSALQVGDPPHILWCCKRLVFKILASQKVFQQVKIEREVEKRLFPHVLWTGWERGLWRLMDSSWGLLK